MAYVSVEEALTLPGMRGTSLLAGHQGLQNQIRAVNIMEVPDVEAFVRAGDLLLTTAYPIHEEPERLLDLVRVFHSRKLAALAIKPGRYLDSLPDGLVELCNDLGFPLLLLRDDLSFDLVIGEVMAVILADYGEPGRADAIRQHLTEHALTGGGLEGIARILSRAIYSQVRIVDANGDLFDGAEYGKVEDGAVYEAFDVTVAGAVRGAIQIQSPRLLTLSQRRLSRQAAFAAGLHIAQSQAAIEVNQQLKALALEELVSGTAEGVRSSAGLFGWDLTRLRQAAVAGPYLARPGLPEDCTRTWGASAQSWARGEYLIVLFNPEELVQTLPAALEKWRDDLGLGPVVTAAGPAVSSGMQLADSYRGALQAWDIARRTARSTVLYESLGMELLLGSIDGPVRRTFVDREIGPLLDTDQAGKSDLANTLYHYLGAPSGREAADRLCIHYNTLKYRLEVIRSLLPDGWEDPDRRAALLLALTIHRLHPATDAA